MKSVPKEDPMTRQEMVAILEEIARDPKQYPSARVTAIRTLRELQAPEKPATDFDALDEVAARRRYRAK